MIGIYTPETKKPGTSIECGGKEASDNLRGLSFHPHPGVRLADALDVAPAGGVEAPCHLGELRRRKRLLSRYGGAQR